MTNLRCNQACTYCIHRSARDDLRFISAAAVRERIRKALANRADGIALTGGEPAMRGDLEALVAHAHAAGAREVVLETNATLIDSARARRLRDAGLARARVNLAAFGDGLDAITRDPGGFRRTVAGVEALASAGVVIDLVGAVVRPTLPLLAGLPAQVDAAFGEAVRSLELAVPVSAPDPRELVSYAEAAAAACEVAHEATRTGLPVAFQRGLGIPPCVLAPGPRGKIDSLFSLSPARLRDAGHSQIEDCAACALSDRCGGFADAYRARNGAPVVHRIRGERWRRRLSLPRAASDQAELDLASRALRPGTASTPDVQSVIRINFDCNQACRFCFVYAQLPAPRATAIRRAIVAAGRRGDWIALSGGEPTLNPRLGEYVRLAVAESRHPVSLQTNAVLLDDSARVAELAEAGLGNAFVSLQGATAQVAEAVTRAPGTLERTFAGLDNLAAAGISLTLNFVACASNAHEAPDAVALTASRWPGAVFNLSFVAASTDAVPRDRVLIPRLSDVVPHLRRAIEAARERGVPLIGVESMCGLPHCILPEALREAALFELAAGPGQADFVKTESCGTCAQERFCWGLRRSYAELHGTDELRPLRIASPPRMAPRS